METKLMSYKMLKTVKGARDGLNVETFTKDVTYELEDHLAEQFYHLAAVDEVTSKRADKRETKVTGPSETKVVTPAEIKSNGLAGEAGVPLQTQRIEELVSVARDIYDLEVDSTMSEEHVEGLIEAAKGKDEDDADSTKSAKHANKKPHGKK